MAAYFNEFDPYAAQWLRNLIAAGHIAAGEVDERSIEDVRPDDLRGFTQCHFFAGIGVWSYSLRLAGWPDDRPVWTGSCPCQPFSAAGKGAGFSDERHLWPAWAWLIGECRPPVILGEQVASKDINPWIDLVQADLEAMGYALGCVPFPSAGIGAPHIRDRAYFMAHANHARSQGRRRMRERAAERAARSSGVAGVVGNASSIGFEERNVQLRQSHSGTIGVFGKSAALRAGTSSELGNAEGGRQSVGLWERGSCWTESPRGPGSTGDEMRLREPGAGIWSGAGEQRVPDSQPVSAPSAVNGFWSTAEWIWCKDEKWRPVEPGTFPLADGAPARVGRLRAYGNAINAQAAAEFIRASREAIEQ